MAETLKPGAFRVWDGQEKRYLTGAERMNFALNPDGDLMRAEVTSALFRQATVEPADPMRYTAEHAAGFLDRRNQPVHENDVVQFYACGLFLLGQIKFTPEGWAAVEWTDAKSDAPCFSGLTSGVVLVLGTTHDNPAVLRERARGIVA